MIGSRYMRRKTWAGEEDVVKSSTQLEPGEHLQSKRMTETTVTREILCL
jgi:hypothetical protein